MDIRDKKEHDPVADLYTVDVCMRWVVQAAEEPMCWGFNGSLQEGLNWQIGKEFDIVEVECRAMGAPACVWEVSKTPKS